MMAFSWLQKRQVKVVASGSRYGRTGLALRVMKYGKGSRKMLADGLGVLFWGPEACVMTSCAFPMSSIRTMDIWTVEEGLLLDAPWLQIAVVNEGFQG
jgi:hypothetical protein